MVRAVILIALLGVGACLEVEPIPDDTGAPHTTWATGTGTGASDTGDTDTEGTGGTASSTAGMDGTGSDGTTGPCVPGAEGCSCTPGGGCDPGLTCLSELCVDVGGGCPVGSEGCPCTPGGGCDPGLACQSMVCVDPGG
ncbi:MAG: hypothetical protein H6712_08530 [Myxococcales bacterium]|nr:hypothetical protein [Myxococcales bacterium]